MADATDPLIRLIYERARADSRDTIQLSVVGGGEIDEALGLWGGTALERQRRAGEALARELDPNPFARYIYANENSEPLRRILRSVRLRWSCFAIRERPYFDLEFWDAHQRFYDTSLLQQPLHCERFHFFAKAAWGVAPNANEEEQVASHLLRLFHEGLPWEGIEGEIAGIEYCGYCVLRPTLSFCVGRSAIRFDWRSDAELASQFPGGEQKARDHYRTIDLEHGGRPFLKCHQDCITHVLGTRLSIRSIEFMQQDPCLGMCATVSIWVATHACSETFGLNRFNYPTITRQALSASSSGRELTSLTDPTAADSGLFSYEMRRAIAQTGAKTLDISADESRDVDTESMILRQEIYSFVESGVPVILNLDSSPDGEGEGHALVIVGHSLPSYGAVAGYKKPIASCLGDMGGAAGSAQGDQGIYQHHYLVSSFIPVYYAQDDGYGPFNRVVFLPAAGSSKLPPVEVGGRESTVMYLRNAVIPVPPIVQGRSEHRLLALLTFFDKMLLGFVQEAMDSEEVPILWRSLLVEGAAFKASLRPRHYGPDITKWYSQMVLPKYVWLFEMSAIRREADWEGQFSAATPRDILGEFLYDPTTSPLDPRCLAFRFMNLGYDYSQPAAPSGGTAFDWPQAREFPFDKENAFSYRCYENPFKGSNDGNEGQTK